MRAGLQQVPVELMAAQKRPWHPSESLFDKDLQAKVTNMAYGAFGVGSGSDGGCGSGAGPLIDLSGAI